MANELPFLDLNGAELLNGARSAAYIAKFGDAAWEIAGLGCSVLTREVGAPAGGVFVSAAADPAPWYDGSSASTDFLGYIVSSIDWLNADISRTVTQRGGGLGGANLGPELQPGKVVKVTGALAAVTCAGLEYGRAWLQEQLTPVPGCALGTIRLRDQCPPDNGSADTTGEWTLYDVGCTSGLVTIPPDERCCEIEGFTFTLVAGLPLKYARRATSIAAATIPESPILGPSPRGTVTDTFTRANAGPPPSASWSAPIVVGEANTLVVDTNTLKSTATPLSTAWWNANTYDRDMLVSAAISTADNSGTMQILLFTRVLQPNTAAVSGIAAFIQCNAGQTIVTFYQLASGAFTQISDPQAISWTLTAADVLVLEARGPAVELWVVRAATNVARVGVAYDLTNGAAVAAQTFFGGVGISGSTTLRLVNWTSRTVASRGGIELPTLDPVTVDLGAPKIGRNALILTLDNSLEPIQSLCGLKVMTKPLLPASVQFADDYATDKLLTRYFRKLPLAGGPYAQVTGGALHPLAAGVTAADLRYLWSVDGTAGGVRSSKRMVARYTFHTGSSVTGGIWGIIFGLGSDNWLVASVIQSGSILRLGRLSAAGGIGTDTLVASSAVTPATATTYTLYAEAEYQGRMSAWLVSSTGDILAEVFATTMGDTIVGTPLFGAGILWKPIDTANETIDNFHVADVAPEPSQIIVAQLPPADTVELDSSRHRNTWTDVNPHTATTTLRDGVGVLDSPPAGWEETSGPQATSLLIPHQAGLSLFNPPKWTAQTQASRR